MKQTIDADALESTITFGEHAAESPTPPLTAACRRPLQEVSPFEYEVAELLGWPTDPSPAEKQALHTAYAADSTVRLLRAQAKQLKFRVDDLVRRIDADGWRAHVRSDGEAHWESVYVDQYCAQMAAEVRVVAELLSKLGHELPQRTKAA